MKMIHFPESNVVEDVFCTIILLFPEFLLGPRLKNRSGVGVLAGKNLTLTFPSFVTGSGKRDIFAQTMIFLYKRCCSKKHNIIYYSKKNFFGLTVSTTLSLHSHQI